MFIVSSITSIFGLLTTFPVVLAVMKFFKVVYYPENL